MAGVDFLGQEVNVDDRVLFYNNRYKTLAWGRITKLTPQKAHIDFDTGKTSRWGNGKIDGSTLKFHADLVVIGEDMKQAIAIKKLIG